jgi:hypothetical protein
MRIPRMLQSQSRHEMSQDADWLEELAKLDSQEILKRLQIETKHFQFALILIGDTIPEEIPPIIKRVVGTAVQHGATMDLTSSLLLGLLGVPSPKNNSPEVRRGLVNALLRENGDRIRIAHGECDGPVGLLGTDIRFTYTALIPGLSAILRKLLETKFGTAVEIS